MPLLLFPMRVLQGPAYGGTYDLVHKEFANLGITATKVDISQPPHTWEQHLQDNTKVDVCSIVK